jgi:hypothetical protein
MLERRFNKRALTTLVQLLVPSMVAAETQMRTLIDCPVPVHGLSVYPEVRCHMPKTAHAAHEVLSLLVWSQLARGVRGRIMKELCRWS